jgi:hypothetical protein
LLHKLLEVDKIEGDFGKLHLLVDKVFSIENDLQQNSRLFHLKFALFLSSIVQMKNSLAKYLDYEAKDSNPLAQLGTQLYSIHRFAEKEIDWSTTGGETINDINLEDD